MLKRDSRKHKNMWVKLLWTTQRKQENAQSAEPPKKSERERQTNCISCRGVDIIPFEKVIN